MMLAIRVPGALHFPTIVTFSRIKQIQNSRETVLTVTVKAGSSNLQKLGLKWIHWCVTQISDKP